MTPQRRLTLYSTCLVLAMTVYVACSSPGNVAVTRDGRPNGISNQLRAAIQSDRFWKDQLVKIDAEIEHIIGAPQRQAEVDARMRKHEENAEALMNRLYAEHPNLRPTEAEQKAEILRARADEVEAQEFDELVRQARFRRLADLRHIRSLIAHRVAAGNSR